MRKICFVTGSRAEYGILSGLMALIQADQDLQLQIIATNMHLSPEFGLTYKEIEKDGFTIDKKVEMLVSSDSANGTTKSVGLGTIGLADAYDDLKPDLIVVLGDRYEMLAAVNAALFYKIPVAHLHGGEITEGAYDDAIRHAITKMSHLHFTSTEEYRKRVVQMGENPDHVFYVGALGVENALSLQPLEKTELEKQLDFELGKKSLLITFHPVTLEQATAKEQCENLLKALDHFPEYKLLFTMPNSDTDGRVIIQLIDEFVSAHKERAKAFTSLGKLRYLSALTYVTAAIGNSSSGLIEVPAFGKPTLNIGDRQKGRAFGPSVVHCGNSVEEMMSGLKHCLSDGMITLSQKRENPYFKEHTADAILHILKTYPLRHLISKTFYNINQY